jgi:hypothetical protein
VQILRVHRGLSLHGDAKLCVEIGAAILYDKPLILLVAPGAKVPKNLERAAARIIRGSALNEETSELLHKAISEVVRPDEK